MAAHISKVKGRTFVPNRQHDVPEVLGYALEGMANASVEFGNICYFSLCSTVTCNICGESSSRLETSNILSLPLEASVAKSLQSFFAEEPLTGISAFHCVVCGELQEAVKTLHLVSIPRMIFAKSDWLTSVH